VVLRYLHAHRTRDAEDILGDVFVQVVRKLPDFTGDERDFRAWVLTIARNRVIDAARRERRRVIQDGNGHGNEQLTEVLAARGGVEDAAQARLSLAETISVLEVLRRDQREVVFLRVFADLSVEEVAIVMGKTAGAIKALQARGLAAIRDELLRNPSPHPTACDLLRLSDVIPK
jgi:RNA polymerase sigma-70 factor (ECF subfamily)